MRRGGRKGEGKKKVGRVRAGGGGQVGRGGRGGRRVEEEWRKEEGGRERRRRVGLLSPGATLQVPLPCHMCEKLACTELSFRPLVSVNQDFACGPWVAPASFPDLGKVCRLPAMCLSAWQGPQPGISVCTGPSDSQSLEGFRVPWIAGWGLYPGRRDGELAFCTTGQNRLASPTFLASFPPCTPSWQAWGSGSCTPQY